MLCAAVLVLAVLDLAAANPNLFTYYKSAQRPCPDNPPADVDIDQLLGSWHLSLLLLFDSPTYLHQYSHAVGNEAADLDLDQEQGGGPTCAKVELSRVNASSLQLDWLLHQLDVPGGLADLRLQVPAVVGRQPGVWALSTPLGGEVLSTVQHAVPRSLMVLRVCGDHGGVPVHLFTGLLTRTAPSSLGSLELLRLSRLVLGQRGGAGFLQRQRHRLLSWSEC